MYAQTLAAVATLASAASAQAYQGFNYGATFTDNSPKSTQDFTNEFNTAQKLVGASGFTSARLYTMIQAGTTNQPISAIQAAINTNTSLLLGMWCSAGQDGFNNELAALKSAVAQYGSSFSSLVAGISVGSEDLYRVTPTGIQNNAGVGAGPADIVNYINQVRQAVQNTPASGIKVGHVDTWTAWVNGSNSQVVQNCDWVGVDSYPYFQTNDSNGIDNGANLFQQAFDNTTAAAAGKPVWITETGWPVSGAQSGQAVASIANAKQYWDQVACKFLGKTNTWWYTLQDVEPTTPNPSFGITGGPQLTSTPLFDLSCSNTTTNSTTGGSGNGGSGNGNGGSSGSGTGSGSGSSGGGSGSSGSGSGSSGSGSGSSGSGSGSSGSGSGSSGSGSSGSGSGSSGSGSGSSGSGSGSSGSGTGSSGSGTGSSGSDSPGSGSGSSGSGSGSGSGSSGSGSGSSGSGSSGSGSGSSGSGSGASGYAPAPGSSSTSPYGPYGSPVSSPGASVPGAKSSPGAQYTGAASANKPIAALFAGAFGLAALFA